MQRALFFLAGSRAHGTFTTAHPDPPTRMAGMINVGYVVNKIYTPNVLKMLLYKFQPASGLEQRPIQKGGPLSRTASG